MTSLSTLTSHNDLFGAGQIRLQQIAMYNWGTFDGLHLADIHRGGTLITGITGAGKTTAADALITLINGTKSANYNAAAAKEGGADRSLVTYVRGSYGSEADDEGEGGAISKYKRPGPTASLAMAQFVQDDGRHFTIGMMFWIGSASNAAKDISRLYFTSRREIPATEVLDAAGARGKSALKQHLEDDAASRAFEKLADYQASLRQLLCLENENATALLARALGLKEIRDLTSLLRDLVLEPSQVPDNARKAINSFETLDATHSKLVEAREQRDLLEALPTLEEERSNARAEQAVIAQAETALPIYIAEQAAGLAAAIIEQGEDDLAELEGAAERLGHEKSEQETRRDELYQAYLSEGGDRITQVESRLQAARETLDDVIRARRLYDEDIDAAGFSAAGSAAELARQMEQAGNKFIEVSDLSEKAEAQRDDFVFAQKETERRITALIAEIREIDGRKDSNVAPEYQRVRDTLCQAVGVDRDTLPFVAELMDVKSGEAQWRGAIERALGFDRLNLLVPEEHYSQVRRYLNEHYLGVRVVVQRVEENLRGSAEFLPDGFLRKLEWRKHPYREFLKHHLVRRDYHCVDSPDEMQAREFCITREGLIQRSHGKLEKDDRYDVNDKRRWCLGFSNQLVLEDRKEALESTTVEHEAARKSAEALARTLKGYQSQLNALKNLERHVWERIDVASAEADRTRLQQEYDALMANSDKLRDLQQAIEDAKSEIVRIEGRLKEVHQKIGECDAALGKRRRQREEDLAQAQQGVEDGPRSMLDELFEPMADPDLERRDEFRSQRSQVLGQKKESRVRAESRCDSQISRILGAFSERWVELAIDWGTDENASTAEYIGFYHKLVDEGLPDLEQEFQKLLTEQSSQSLTSLVTMLNNEHREIDERIEIINGVLRKTTFREGSYLKLGLKKLKDPAVQAIPRHVRAVREADGHDDSEQRYAAIKAVIDLLRKHIELNTKQAQRTLDPRHQLAFYAEEMWKHNDERRDYLASSAGKSGGEKESFAGIIVAASLAYVLSPDGSDKPIYATVFLDEAFSNTSEAVARRVLEVFKQLHLHVNLITPMKNLNIAQDAAATLLITLKDDKLHSSRFSELSWERAEALYQAAVAEGSEEEVGEIAAP